MYATAQAQCEMLSLTSRKHLTKKKQKQQGEKIKLSEYKSLANNKRDITNITIVH